MILVFSIPPSGVSEWGDDIAPVSCIRGFYRSDFIISLSIALPTVLLIGR